MTTSKIDVIVYRESIYSMFDVVQSINKSFKSYAELNIFIAEQIKINYPNKITYKIVKEGRHD